MLIHSHHKELVTVQMKWMVQCIDDCGLHNRNDFLSDLQIYLLTRCRIHNNKLHDRIQFHFQSVHTWAEFFVFARFRQISFITKNSIVHLVGLCQWRKRWKYERNVVHSSNQHKVVSQVCEIVLSINLHFKAFYLRNWFSYCQK
jgi:hypothetical protein